MSSDAHTWAVNCAADLIVRLEATPEPWAVRLLPEAQEVLRRLMNPRRTPRTPKDSQRREEQYQQIQRQVADLTAETQERNPQ